MPIKPKHSRRRVSQAIWVAIIELIGTISAALITKVQGLWPFAPRSGGPLYEAWMEITPNPVVRGSRASIQFFFNNGSNSRVRLTRMTAWDPCDANAPPTTVDSHFPGWKGSIVEPQTHKHNFYGAEHANFPYSCGAQAGETATLSYKFDLLFDEGEPPQTRAVSFAKVVFAVPAKR